MADAKLFPATTPSDPRWITHMVEHPDGGFTPAKETDRGDYTAPCPACGTPLVRNAGLRAVHRASVRCKCGQEAVGFHFTEQFTNQNPGDVYFRPMDDE